MSRATQPTTVVPHQAGPTTPAIETGLAAPAASLEAALTGEDVASEAALELQPGQGNAGLVALLTDQGWLDTVTDAESTAALDELLALPIDARGAAIDALGDDEFHALLEELPEERRRELGALVAASEDTQRKLALWQVAHVAEARALLEGAEEDPSFFDRSEAADLARHRDDVRADTLSATEDEVADELRHIEARLARGETVPPEEVDALAARKALELELETTYGVNLTNQGGASGLLALLRPEALREAGRRVWSFDELIEVGAALARLPTAQVRDNAALHEIRRMEGTTHGLQVSHGSFGATRDGRIEIYDEAAVMHPPSGAPGQEGSCPKVNPLRTVRTSELAQHMAGQSGPNGELSQMQDAISHEIGHTVHVDRPEIFEAVKAASGWRHLDREALADFVERTTGARPSEEEIDRLDSTLNAPDRDRQPQRSGDWSFGLDPYARDGYLVHRADAIPEDDHTRAALLAGATDEDGNPCPVGPEDWNYARTSPEEQFAELYTKVVHQPEALYDDLVRAPEATIQGIESQIDQTAIWLDEALAAGDDEGARTQRARQERLAEELARAREMAEARAAQWSRMRELVWGAPLPIEGAPR